MILIKFQLYVNKVICGHYARNEENLTDQFLLYESKVRVFLQCFNMGSYGKLVLNLLVNFYFSQNIYTILTKIWLNVC